MNEFIVWDEENYFGEDNQFYTWEELVKVKEDFTVFDFDFLSNDELFIRTYMDDGEYGNTWKDVKIKTFDYIGKTDIEGNKIYADSSIVEFDFIYYETIGKQSDKVKVKGYFSFNNETAAYDLIFFHHWINSMPNYWINMLMKKEKVKRASNFKIIGTLQENKELL